MTTYAATLPWPSEVTYAGTTDRGAQQTAIVSPASDQGVKFNTPRTEITLTWHMDDADLLAWQTWVHAYAWDWFDMDLVTPTGPVDIVALQTVRFISPYETSKQGYNWNEVTVQAEIIPAGGQYWLAQQPAPHDFSIQAGTPASPSTDWILAGTPADPSTDYYIASLYKY